MRNRICVLLLSIFIISMYIQYNSVYSANQNQPNSWYLKFNKPNTPPEIGELNEIIQNHNVIYLDKSGEKRIYLTFDVGYDDGNVGTILDALKKHNAKGAFFVLPHFIMSSPDLIQRLIDEGHLICNHTTHHKNMSAVASLSEFKHELTEIEEIFKSETGKDMAKYFRPPEGRFNERTLAFADELGYKTVFWSLAYADWDSKKQPDPEKALGLLLSRVHDGCVLLLHPTSSTNARIMDRLLTELENKGYTFSRIDDYPIEDNPVTQGDSQ